MQFIKNVLDPAFGGKDADGSWTTAFQKAIDSIATNTSNTSGGVVFIPRGVYILKTSVIIKTLEVYRTTSITLEGEGMHSSVLDFNHEGGGLIIQHGDLVKLRAFSIKNSAENNIHVDPPTTAIETDNPAFRDSPSHLELTNIRSKGAAKNGLLFENGFLISMRDVFSSDNGENGFQFSGFHTSTNAISCFAAKNNKDGWVINDMVYSSFISCAADKNRHGWNLSNVTATKLMACGSEKNKGAGIYAHAVTGETPPPTFGGLEDVENLSLESCFGFANNTEGGYSNFLYLKSDGQNKASVHLKNCSDYGAGDSNSSVVINGSGAELINDRNQFEKSITAVSGGVNTLVQYSSEIGPVTIATALVDIRQLKDVYGNTTTFGGLITVVASNKSLSDSVANTATYLLHVSKTVTGVSIHEISKLGLTQGNGDSWPSFTFSLSPNGVLTAQGIGSTSGNFYFQLSASGNLSLV